MIAEQTTSVGFDEVGYSHHRPNSGPVLFRYIAGILEHNLINDLPHLRVDNPDLRLLQLSTYQRHAAPVYTSHKMGELSLYDMAI